MLIWDLDWLACCTACIAMLPNCPKCDDSCAKIVRFGSYYRTSDSKWIQRFRCQTCKAGFSRATFQSCYRQKKRQKNVLLRKLLCSGVSQRRAARILNVHRITVVRKFLFLSLEATFALNYKNYNAEKIKIMEFDDMETFEHSKCKPLSITLAVESQTRRILGIEVSRMPPKGLLARVKKYGPRPDERPFGRKRLFEDIRSFILEDARLKSDSNPHYPKDVAQFFPNAKYSQYLGKRGAITGQGELKKVRFDPLFSLNHTAAKFRADVNRLFRRTWCTTKNPGRLRAHLILYSVYHNEHLV